MKKYTFAVFAMLFCFTILFNPVASAVAATKVNVLLNGEKKEFTPDVLLAIDTTFAPFPQFFEQLGATASYDEKTKTIKASKDDTEIQLTLNSEKAYVNGKEYYIKSTPSTDGNGVIYVNVRFISEAFGYKVRWEKSTLTVHITSK